MLAVEIWARLRSPATVIPEGGDDVELRGEEITLVQVKSRRGHLGDYPVSDAARYVEELWERGHGSLRVPDRLEIILERGMAGMPLIAGGSGSLAIGGPLAERFPDDLETKELLRKTSIVVAASPQESSISAIVDRLGCVPIAAQMCFADLLTRVGVLADANGRRSPEDYVGLSASDTEAAISQVLEAVDTAAIERAILEGVCEPVDFLTPLDDPRFYLGVDVEPGHVAAGLIAERPGGRLAVIRGIEERRAALVVGPSGAGKTALMWDAANTLRHTVRWFRIRRLSETDIPAVRQLIRTFRASEESPLGFVMDDVGRNGPEAWGDLLREAMSVPGVVVLGSVREEDVRLIAERARAAEVRADPDDELAERLWRELKDTQKTAWVGWREPWQLSDGLLLEYVHILTRGRRMQEVLSDQVSARIADPARTLELDILRSAAWAGSADAEIDTSRLAKVLSVSDAEMSRALRRLIDEHLVQLPKPGILAGLHQLRSEELLRLTHQFPLPILTTSFERTVASVSAADLEPLVAVTIAQRRLTVPFVLDGLVLRLESEPDPQAMAAALRGLGTGGISAGVDEWFDTPDVVALPPTQVEIAGIFGIAGSDLSGLEFIAGVRSAADRLAQIKGSPQDDPRRLLMERMSSETISVTIRAAELASLADILAALVGVPLSDVVRAAISDPPCDLMDADLGSLATVLGTLAAIDRGIAERWIERIGQQAFFDRVQSESAWAGQVSTETGEDGLIVSCDYWYVAASKQKNPHDAVVTLCETILAVCPGADIAWSRAVTASGEVAGFADLPLATKRIPRENLPPPSVVQWNRRWRGLISRRVAAPSYSDYLARGMVILDTLVLVLGQVFDAHLRGRNVRDRLINTLNSLNQETERLTPPAVSAFAAAGSGSTDENKVVTKLQNLLHSATVDLVRRFALLPEQAGAYIAWLNDLIADIDAIAAEEPWQLVADGAPPTLHRLKALLETLRSLAGESHERGEPPATTWAAQGGRARPGNALRLISAAADAASERRMSRRRVDLERAASESEIDAIFHLRFNPGAVLPWPPADVLALLPARGLAEAITSLERSATRVRSLVDSYVHLTVMPVVEGVALDAFARSGHATMLPDVESGAAWSSHLSLPAARSETADAFGDVISLASELGAMDRLRLGLPDRSPEESKVRRDLEGAFQEKRNDLERRLRVFDEGVRTTVADLISRARNDDVDLAAEAQAALGGGSSDVIGDVGYMTLHLFECDRQAFNANGTEGIVGGES